MGRRGDLHANLCTHRVSWAEYYWTASVLGAENLLVRGHHLAIMHVHDLCADLAAGRGHWGRGKRVFSAVVGQKEARR